MIPSPRVRLGILAIAVILSSHSALSSQAQQLVAGSRIQQRITGTEPQRYEIRLRAGDFLQIHIENYSNNARNPTLFTLVTAEGRKLAEADEESMRASMASLRPSVVMLSALSSRGSTFWERRRS